jgi:cytochrome P450
MVRRHRTGIPIYKLPEPKIHRYGSLERNQTLAEGTETQGPFLLHGMHPVFASTPLMPLTTILFKAESAGTAVDDLRIILPDVILAIIAGSDTTASALTNAIYLLLTHPVALRALTSELDEAFQKHDIPNVSTISTDQEVERFSDVLAGLKYLNGVV